MRDFSPPFLNKFVYNFYRHVVPIVCLLFLFHICLLVSSAFYRKKDIFSFFPPLEIMHVIIYVVLFFYHVCDVLQVYIRIMQKVVFESHSNIAFLLHDSQRYPILGSCTKNSCDPVQSILIFSLHRAQRTVRLIRDHPHTVHSKIF